MDFAIGIPSYRRADRQPTVEYLSRCGVPRDLVHLQTQTEEDYAAYSERWGRLATVRFAPATSAAGNRNNLVATLNLTTRRVLLMDDDVARVMVLRKEGERKNGGGSVDAGSGFLRIAERLFAECDRRGADLFGAYPYENPYFQRNRASLNRLCVGCFMGLNRRGLRFDEKIGVKDDWELCCRLISRGRKTLRFDYVSVVTEYGTVGGGCKPLYDGGQGRLAVKTLLERYPGLLKRGRNDTEVQLKRTCGGKA